MAVPEKVAAPAVRVDPMKSAKTVMVCSKLPMSIWIHVDKSVTRKAPGRYGSEDETIFVPGKQYYIRGISEPAGQAPKKYKRPTMLEGGFALTTGIPADFWEAWLKQHEGDDMVVNKLIWAHPSREHVEGHAEEHAKLESGFQPIDPDNMAKDPRMPKPLNVNEVEEIAPGTRD